MITEEKIREVMGGLFRDIDVAGLRTDQTFKEYGLDSLDQYNLIVELQTLTGREVPDADVNGLQTIRTLVDYFRS